MESITAAYKARYVRFLTKTYIPDIMSGALVTLHTWIIICYFTLISELRSAFT